MKPTRRSSLFLLELMLSILLFILAATICVQVFVKSHSISKKSTELSHAVLASSSVAEILKSNVDHPEILLKQYPFIVESDDCLFIYFDANWQHTDEANASYLLQLCTQIDDSFLINDITVCNISEKESVIYHLETKKYTPKEGVHEN